MLHRGVELVLYSSGVACRQCIKSDVIQMMFVVRK
jgi:hypothetical protein